jgi:hypothetical protein
MMTILLVGHSDKRTRIDDNHKMDIPRSDRTAQFDLENFLGTLSEVRPGAQGAEP